MYPGKQRYFTISPKIGKLYYITYKYIIINSVNLLHEAGKEKKTLTIKFQLIGSQLFLRNNIICNPNLKDNNKYIKDYIKYSKHTQSTTNTDDRHTDFLQIFKIIAKSQCISMYIPSKKSFLFCYY